jgi:propionyl-CoA carboxylase alpha chain
MSVALDEFEVEGIGHNLPFLSAVMEHPRFRSGEITTAFIAEDYPEGFAGAELSDATLRDLAALAAALHLAGEKRAARISGRLSYHERNVGDAWVVGMAGRSWPVRLVEEPDGAVIAFEDGARLAVASDGSGAFWAPVVRASVDGRSYAVKVGRVPGGYRMRHRGADLAVSVRSARHAELAAKMPHKAPPDTSKFLLCPMPGLVVRIDVAEGDEVFDGQSLAMIEAMKMENVLRAERKARVAKIHARPGDSLSVDAVILEFD